MTEEEARAWVRDRFGVSRETALARFGAMLVEESARQNLIARSTFETLWSRHLVDSAQLVPLAAAVPAGAWIDIGSGAGLPGLVVALLSERQVYLIEPRAKRVAFLRDAAAALGLSGQVSVIAARAENWRPAAPAAVISARAVAQLSALLTAAAHFSDSSTIWLLPKGQNAQSEVDAARAKWQGRFHVEPSITQPESGIVIATQIGAR